MFIALALAETLARHPHTRPDACGPLQVSLKQPGNALESGVQAAVQAMGNLARGGYPTSGDGEWPFAYNTCDDVARYGQADWANSAVGAQAHSACSNSSAYGFVPFQGRGAPVVDVFSLAVEPSSWDVPRGAYVVTGLHVAPKIPLNTAHGGGLAGDCSSTTDACTGITFYPDNGFSSGISTWCMQMGATSGILADEVHVGLSEGERHRRKFKPPLPPKKIGGRIPPIRSAALLGFLGFWDT